MPFTIKVQEVNIEEVRNGRNKYDKAVVSYLFNGAPRTQNIMSFSNPAVFAQVRAMKAGEEYSVTVTKNDRGYDQWAKLDAVTGDAPAEKATPGRTSVSTYETAEERKVKQLYIVKQSSITNALAYLNATQPAHDYGVTDVLDVAQKFVDYVYGIEDLFDEQNDIPA